PQDLRGSPDPTSDEPRGRSRTAAASKRAGRRECPATVRSRRDAMQHAVPLALFAALTLGGATSESDAGQAPEPFVLEAGRHELVDVIERAADYLDHNYLYQETEFQAGDTGVTLQTKLALSPREAQEVLSQLLYSRGFLMVPLNEKRALWEIISVAGPRRAEITARPKDMSPAEVRANENLMIVVRTPVALHTI